MTTVSCPNVWRSTDHNQITGFGLGRIKIEGAPQHPDDYDWEHPPGSGCVQCQERYDRALKRYNDYYSSKHSS